MRNSFFSPVLLLVFVVAGWLLTSKATAQSPPDILKILRSDVMRQGQKMQGKITYRSLWSGSGTDMMLLGLVRRPEYQEALGITQEQMESFNATQQAFQRNPKVVAAMQQMQKYQTPDDPYFEKMSPESQKNFLAEQEKFATLMAEELPRELGKVLTPDQKKKIQEIQIAAMEYIPLLNPEMFHALDLTEEQKAEMEAIKKEFGPEFDEVAESLIDAMNEGMDLVYDQIEKDGTKVTSGAELQKYQREAIKKLEASGVNYKMIAKNKVDNAQDFVKRFKFRMFDVLTDAQMKRMWDLIHNPPDYMKKIVENLKKNRESKVASGEWRPGFDSWKPGDPIPNEYIETRKAKFPKKK